MRPPRCAAYFDPVTVTGYLEANRKRDEDCLRVSVVAPESIEGGKAPVPVFIHGGGYIRAAGDNAAYVPRDLAKKGVVVVNVTYRPGIRGYLQIAGVVPLISAFWIRSKLCGGFERTFPGLVEMPPT